MTTNNNRKRKTRRARREAAGFDAEYEKDMAACNDIIKTWDAEVAEAAAALAADDIDGGARGSPKRSK